MATGPAAFSFAPKATGAAVSSSTANLMPLTRFSAINGSQPTNYSSSTWRQYAAKFNYIEFTNHPGMEGAMSGGQTVSSAMADTKSRAAALGSPLCLTGIYEIPQEPPSASSGAPFQGFYAAANANQWWLRQSGTWPTGPIQTDGSANVCVDAANVDGTPITPLGASGWSSGLDYCQAAAVHGFNTFINGTPSAVGEAAVAANPNCDVITNDNQVWNPFWGGQWQCNNTVHNSGLLTGGTDTTVFPLAQAGHKRRIAKWKAICPNAGSGKPLMHGANCGAVTTGFPWNGVSETSAYTASLQGLYDLPFSEAMFGSGLNASAANFNLNTLLGKMAKFEYQVNTSNPRAFPAFNCENGPCNGVLWPSGGQTPSNWAATFSGTSTQPTNSGGQATSTGTFWQAARMVVCFALLRGWGVEFQSGNGVYIANDPWMDEYQKGSAAVWNWLGVPIDAPLLTTNLAQGSQGMYVRRFTNGTAYLNPLGNGTQTITIQDSHKRELTTAGFGDPAINNGTLHTTTFTMYDGDGRILI
jgi:hypothetical protein